MKKFIIALSCALIFGCTPVVDEKNNPIAEVPTPVDVPKPQTPSKKNVCELSDFKVELVGPKKKWNLTVQMPFVGKFVGECHYVTALDKQIKTSPKSSTDGIQEHLDRECLIYQTTVQNIPCDKIFNDKWDKCWTPSEGGTIGEGAVGIDWQKKSLMATHEMWGMNMMWGPGQKPKPGTRFLLSFNGKSVVAYAGNETGPGSNEFLGGVSPAIHAYLGANNSSQIVISYLKDQTLDFGPINCGGL